MYENGNAQNENAIDTEIGMNEAAVTAAREAYQSSLASAFADASTISAARAYGAQLARQDARRIVRSSLRTALADVRIR